jgi:hypothetical protein
MATIHGQHAIDEALRAGRAILKFISANDVNKTGAHQYGFYLPKEAWPLFTPHQPEKGVNKKSWPKVRWQNGLETASCVTWYGKGTRREYRLTRFQHDFPYLTEDSVGNLLVIVPISHDEFHAYVLDLDEDIQDVQAALDTQVAGRFAVYESGATPAETENSCLDREFRDFLNGLRTFPNTTIVSSVTRHAVATCVRAFVKRSPDSQLVRWVTEEFRLFRMIERRFAQDDVVRLFKDIDDFLKTASKLMQARKSRAGRSLENHIEHLFIASGLKFEMRRILDGTRPDVIIPSKAAYDDPRFPREKLIAIGIKTTCKDRWRQVLREAPQVHIKHILTTQRGISIRQLNEMHESNVVLVVPKVLHKDYPKKHAISILTLEQFIRKARGILR